MKKIFDTESSEETQSYTEIHNKKFYIHRRKEQFMERYLVESPHKKEDCTHALKQVEALGYLTHFEWGCASGNHTGFIIIEAENEAQARMVVPSMSRKAARVVKLNRFTPEMLQASH